jgi:hypothetical protein
MLRVRGPAMLAHWAPPCPLSGLAECEELDMHGFPTVARRAVAQTWSILALLALGSVAKAQGLP